MSGETGGFIFLLVLCLAFIALGIVDIVNPELSWKLFERWKSNRAENSSYFYDQVTRAGGIVVVVIGVFLAAICLLGIFGGNDVLDGIFWLIDTILG